MSKIQVIRKGESLPFSFDRGGAAVGGWTCTIHVKRYPADTSIISRTIPLTDCAWSGYLTQTETAALSTGLHYLVALMVNIATDEEEEVPLRFNVVTNWQ